MQNFLEMEGSGCRTCWLCIIIIHKRHIDCVYELRVGNVYKCVVNIICEVHGLSYHLSLCLRLYSSYQYDWMNYVECYFC